MIIKAADLENVAQEKTSESISPNYPISADDPGTSTSKRVPKTSWTVQQVRGQGASKPRLFKNVRHGLYSFLWPADNIDTASSETIEAVTEANARPRWRVGYSRDRGTQSSAYSAYKENAVVVSTNARSANGKPGALDARVLAHALFIKGPEINHLIVVSAIKQNYSANRL